MTEQLPDFLEDFDEKKESGIYLPTTQKKDLADPLGHIRTSDVRRAKDPKGKDPSMAGKQIRRGVLLPPEMDEEINRLVKEYGIKKMAFMRYLIAAGLERVHKHGLEQDMIEKRTVELAMPAWKGNA